MPARDPHSAFFLSIALTELKLASLGLSIGAILALGLWRYFELAPDARSRPLAPDAVSAAAASPAGSRASTVAKRLEAPIAASQPAAPGATAAVNSSELTAAFRKTPNLLAFIHDAMGKPESGGRFYAILAFHHCLQIAKVTLPPTESMVSVEQQKAALRFAQEIARCDGVWDRYSDPYDAVALYRQASDTRGGADALVPPGGRGLLTSAVRSTAASDFESARSSGDPYAATVVFEANVDHLAPTIFGNQLASIPPDVLYAASGAIACELADTCFDSIRTLGPCALAGDCEHTDLRLMRRASLPVDQQSKFDEVLAAMRAYVRK